MRNPLRSILLALLVAGCGAALAADAHDPNDLTLPARFQCMLMILDSRTPGTVSVETSGVGTTSGPGTVPPAGVPTPSGHVSSAAGSPLKYNSALLSITIDRWSTDDEQAGLVQAQKSGGTSALVSRMEKTTVGFVQVNGELRWPIRMATTWTNGSGRVISLATNGPIVIPAATSRSISQSYPVGIIELTLPSDGRGEGTLVAATRAEFDNRGRIVPTVTPPGTGVQRLTGVERVGDPDKP
jgi:hypothetical protein